MRPLRGFLFDLDGTLVNSKNDIANAVNFTLKGFGLPPISNEKIYTYIGNGAKILMRRCINEAGGSSIDIHEAIERFLAYYREHLLDTTMVFPLIHDTLSLIQGRFSAVISNKPQEFCERVLEGLNLKRYFNKVSGGDTTKKKKPSPEVILSLLEEEGIPPERSVMIGDSRIDIEAGKNAGTLTIGVLWGLGKEWELLSAGADLIARTTEELFIMTKGLI